MIQLSAAVRIDGVTQAAGAFLTLSEDREIDLVQRGLASWVGSDLSATWVQVPHLLRLRLTGSGTVRLDSRDRSRTETLGVAEYSVAGVEVIKFPFLGLGAVEMRVTRTGTATCEVLP